MSLEKRSPSFKLLRWAVGFAFGPITIQFMDDLGRPQGRYPEIFMLIALLEVCQEGGHLEEIEGS